MSETRVRRDGCIRVPEELMDTVGMFPGTKIEIRREGDSIVIRKVSMEDDPFAAAARGPDTEAMEKIRRQQKEAAERAKDRFEELIKNPPEIKPEDNPDLWR